MFNYAKDTSAYPLYKAHPYDAGFDICSAQTIYCEPHDVTLIDTGIHISIKPWQMAFVQPRSSTAKLGLLVVTGTIDAGYTGAIKIQVINYTDHPIVVKSGQRLAQLIVHNNAEYGDEPQVVPLSELYDTTSNIDTRGNNGFGSTGE